MPWLEPSLTLKWGPYIKLDSQDELQVVQMVAAAKTAGAITKRQMVEKLAPIFGTKDVSAVLEALEEEAQDELEAAQKVMQASGGANPQQTKPAAGNGAQRPSPNAGAGKTAPAGAGGRTSGG